jgi:aspartate racemase
MKTLGIIGGMSWESTALYYEALNRGIAKRLGGLHSAKLVLGNVDFQEIVDFQLSDSWDAAGALLADIAANLVAAGAEGIALAVNTMHKVAPQIQARINVPFIDIRDVVAKTIIARKATSVGLLGTRYVVEQPFYGDRIANSASCKVLRASEESNLFVHRVIYEELSKGEVTEEARLKVLDILRDLRERGAEMAVMGCTELPMLRLDDVSPIPLLDSTALHVEACLAFMIDTSSP